MDDILASILGAAPTDPQKQQMIAELLRKRSNLGAIGVLSGDKAMSQVGSGLMGQADSYAKQIGENRLKGVDDARTAEYYGMQNRWKAGDSEYRDRALKQALQIAGMNNERMKEIAQLNRDYKNQLADEKVAAKREYEGFKAQERFGKMLQSEGLPAIWEAFDNADAVIKKYEGKNIPGSGMLANTKLGYLTSGEAGREVKGSLATLRDLILNARGGKALTATEKALFLEELGLTALNSDDDLRKAIKRVRDHLARVSQNAYAAYGGKDGDVLQGYVDAGGYLPNFETDDGSADIGEDVTAAALQAARAQQQGAATLPAAPPTSGQPAAPAAPKNRIYRQGRGGFALPGSAE